MEDIPVATMESVKKIARVAVLQVNLLSMDFADNCQALAKSLHLAKEQKASLVVCPELCICGYNCEDHFLEKDTVTHSWQILAQILNTAPDNLLYTLGMPVLHENSLYNCLVCCLNKTILLIKPRTMLNNAGNAMESRWFTAWKGSMCDFALPECVRKVSGQETCKFGVGLLRTSEGVLLEPQMEYEVYSRCTRADVIMLASSSHYELFLYEKRLKYLTHLSEQRKAVILCSNYVGCNGNRLYYDGGSLILSNGRVLSQSQRFSLQPFELSLANVSLCPRILNMSFDNAEVIDVKFELCLLGLKECRVTPPTEAKSYNMSEELGLSASGWMWDYLRRVKAAGFFVPLSGGADSASCAAIVAVLGSRLVEEYKKGNGMVISEVKRIGGGESYEPVDEKDLTSKILCTAYLGTGNSSKDTRERAKNLAKEMGVRHIDGSIDNAVEGIKKTAQQMTSFTPKFESEGGTGAEDLALQNIQARTRLILSYYVAQVLPVITKRRGFYLVVATGNGDECIRGYFTKYDNSSGDLNPIGGWTKAMVNAFLEGWADKYPSLKEIRYAVPSAELKPLAEGKQVQTDEQDMGFTYAELGLLGKLRKVDTCGPVSMFEKLLELWDTKTPGEIAAKVKKFFAYYTINRHKMTCAPAALHNSSGGCDDNRYDQRQFVYNVMWKYQFECLDKMVAEYEKR
eukprot:TRINITY_DN10247_c0_g1_i2.p1 TRINITY_DN10247_c0_g1~~TRINITY_DN10247_c0_g1_i2.p1  ORF type:complete len:697 (-),score=159.72 TRINITY_DN10247_c0_g1_i2:64-2118(-)